MICKPPCLQTVRARVVGDLPVALGMEEMMRQVRSLQLAYEEGRVMKVSIMLLFIILVIDTDLLMY